VPAAAGMYFLTHLFGQVKPGTVLAYFPAGIAFFSHFSWHDSGTKSVSLFKNPPKGILKVLSNGILKAYPTCHEGSKDENYSKAVVHDVR
jgi:hypothetical protein